MERDIKKDVIINKFRLDDESENNANIYNYWSNLLAEEKKRKLKLENKLSYESAKKEIELSIEKPEDLPDNVKMTIPLMNAYINSDEELSEIRDELTECKSNICIFESAVKSLDQRRSDLDNLVKLYGAKYFSTPEGKNSNEQTSIEVRKKLKRKVK